MAYLSEWTLGTNLSVVHDAESADLSTHTYSKFQGQLNALNAKKKERNKHMIILYLSPFLPTTAAVFLARFTSTGRREGSPR